MARLAPSQTVLTTYLGTYESTAPDFVGVTETIPMRAYNPEGAGAIGYMEADLRSASASAPDFSISIYKNSGNPNCSAGSSYCMAIYDGISSYSYPWPYPGLIADGVTHTMNLTVGELQVSAYRLQLNGNELQVDLTVTLHGAFKYQVAVWAQAGGTYSSPWRTTDGTWQTATPTSALTAVWANDGEDKVPSEDIRASQGQAVTNTVWNGSGVNIWGAQNEVVAFNLVLEAAAQAASGVSVSFGTLTGPNGFVISSPAHDYTQVFNWSNRDIELFYVRYLQIVGCGICGVPDQRQAPPKFQLPFAPSSITSIAGPGGGFGNSWAVAGTWSQRPDHDKHYPEIAVPLELYPDGFQIAQGASQSVWADVYIPKTAPAGTYTGSVAISESGVTTHTVPVTLTVQNFALSDIPASKTMLNIGRASLMSRLTGYSLGFEPYPAAALIATNQAYANTWQLLHRHKISATGDDSGYYGPEQANAPSTIAQEALNGSLFTAANNYGGPGSGVGENLYGVSIWSLPGSWLNGDASLNTAVAYTSTNGWEQWFETNAPNAERFVYLCDECNFNAPYAPTQVNGRALALASNPGAGKNIKSLVTIDPQTSLSCEPNVAISVSIPMFNPQPTPENASGCSSALNESAPVSDSTIQGLRAQGKEVWYYNPQRPFVGGFATEEDGVGLREVPWAQWYKNLTTGNGNAGRMYYWQSMNWQWEGSHFYQPAGLDPNIDLFNSAQTWGSAATTADASVGQTSQGFQNGMGVLLYPSYDYHYAGDSAKAPYNGFNLYGTFASLRLKHWRRGIQDVDYLALANAVNPTATQNLVTCMLSRNGYSAPTVFWDIEALGFAINPGWDGTYFGPTAWSASPDDWENARLHLANIIEGRSDTYTCPSN